ncbi:MAG: hypothetical protein PHO27_06245 [Sulfuricurvum sp.]|nr:hypothetical protein [Sulfuricurvum sp.]
MNRFIVSLLFPCILWGIAINTQVSFIGEPTVTLKTLTQAFNAVGYKFDVTSLRFQNGLGDIQGSVVGNRAFNFALLGENLQEQGISIESSTLDQKGLILSIDTQNGIWSVPLIAMDEGSELKRVNSAQWYRVEPGQIIHIEPPYGIHWYPDVAVLDNSMQVLYSLRSEKKSDELKFELPDGGVYLKVSNANGMKVLREGTWIESMSQGR